MTILFARGVQELFEELPDRVKRRATRSIGLLTVFPRMYPVRQRGLLRGYRYFGAGKYLFYYSVSGTEIRFAAILPAMMRLA